ncbi:hypothetical protein BGW36DRAFT_358538 [Talaromyces proteolyticus]|uniref:Fork-head domain-containing protein n=1 Tax=Talaromyces proteolyticus TaxID=1131652 RepID=A0AAD4Q1T0_9EURO|nr:uncharacterized protein BGW36DRAFT_358538 [Talaromyces proteolyticus]KAH8699029.1 hypothetical protein BGW36DRAFT_358538 [Talaromyces proteolyticus]
MDSITPVRQQPILEVHSWVWNQRKSAPSPSSASVITRLTGATLVNSPSPAPTQSTPDTQRQVDVSAATTSKTPQRPQTRKAKNDTIRKIFRKWRNTLPKTDTSYTVRKSPEAMVNDLIAHLNANFAVLIEEAIRESPSQTQSTLGICKNIMRTDEWYRTNRKYGWQQTVALELANNPAFQPIIACRRGKIRSNKSVKWQLTSGSMQPSTMSSTPSDATSWRFPREMQPPLVELPATNAAELPEETSTRQIQSTGQVTTPSPPKYQLMESQARLSGVQTPGKAKLKDIHAENFGTSFSLAMNWGPSKDGGYPNNFSAQEPESSASEIRRWELYDKPMCADQLETTCNEPTPAQKTTRNPAQPDQTKDAGEGSSSDSDRRSGSDEQKRPGGRSDDGSGDRKRKRLWSPERNKNRRRFACVYHKYDPETYGVHNRRYLVCAGAGFEFTSELVRHLGRTHGEHICGRCLRHFDNAQERNIHRGQCIVRLRCSQEERWAGLWRARFPDIPVPDDPYLNLSTSIRSPQPGQNTQSESVPTQADRESGSSSTTPSIPSPYSEAISDTSNAPFSHIPMPNNRNQQAGEPSPPLSATIQLMECRIDCLERRLPGVEDSLRLVLKLVGSSSDHTFKKPMTAPATNSEGLSQETFSYPPYAACDDNTLSIGLDSRNSSSGVSHTTKEASNCPPLGSSESSSSGSSSRNPLSSSTDSPLFDTTNNPFFNDKRGCFDDDISDLIMPNLDFEAWNDEHNPVNGAVPLPPDIHNLPQFWESV